MDPERDDYADNDLPPPRRWPTDDLVTAGLFLVMGGVLAVSVWLALPRFG